MTGFFIHDQPQQYPNSENVHLRAGDFARRAGTLLVPLQETGLETSPDGQELFLCRYKKPGWRLRLDDAATDKTKLAATLRKAAEWLTKRQG